MVEEQKILITLISNAIVDSKLPDDFELGDMDPLYTLAKKHDIAHLAAYAIKKNHLIDSSTQETEAWKKFEKQYDLSQYRVIYLDVEYNRMMQVFEMAAIDYLPLKGTVIRPLYPEPWMRVSADIDILVHADEMEKAEKLLAEELQYQVTGKRGGHHDHVTTPRGFNIDLHFVLNERELPSADILTNIWEYAYPATINSHEFKMPDEYFYLYFMMHNSIHFISGGCGIKPVLDTWILNNRIPFDKQKRKELLTKGCLEKFAHQMEALAEKWLSGKDIGVDKDFEQYILDGGVYGGGQWVEAAQAKTGGNTLLYYLRRTFPSYKFLHQRYPEMKSNSQLPLYWGKRIFDALSKDKKERTKFELQTAWKNNMKSRKMAELFERLGL